MNDRKKLNEIYEAVCNEIPNTALAFRTAYAISIVSQYPYRHIQIVLRLYSSPAEILMGFDVDSCSCGFDGKQVYMTPRCHQALIRQMNTVDMTRRSPTYELRLAKYADRGFEVEVPMLQREKIDRQVESALFERMNKIVEAIHFLRIEGDGVVDFPPDQLPVVVVEPDTVVTDPGEIIRHRFRLFVGRCTGGSTEIGPVKADRAIRLGFPVKLSIPDDDAFDRLHSVAAQIQGGSRNNRFCHIIDKRMPFGICSHRVRL